MNASASLDSIPVSSSSSFYFSEHRQLQHEYSAQISKQRVSKDRKVSGGKYKRKERVNQ